MALGLQVLEQAGLRVVVTPITWWTPSQMAIDEGVTEACELAKSRTKEFAVQSTPQPKHTPAIPERVLSSR